MASRPRQAHVEHGTPSEHRQAFGMLLEGLQAKPRALRQGPALCACKPWPDSMWSQHCVLCMGQLTNGTVVSLVKAMHVLFSDECWLCASLCKMPG